MLPSPVDLKFKILIKGKRAAEVGLEEDRYIKILYIFTGYIYKKKYS
jgi:hypothetical protein